MDVGTELREARQRAGMSREQLSQRTNIPVAEIEALEQNAFDRLVGGFYLDRIVRAYAYAVGLADSSRLVEQARAAHNMAAALLLTTADPRDLAPADDDAVDAFPAESTLVSPAASTPVFSEGSTPVSESSPPVPEAARRGNAILPVALVAAFVGGITLGTFMMYLSDSRETLGATASRPASAPASTDVDKTPGVATTGPAPTDSAAPRNSAATAAPAAAMPGSASDGPAARPSAAPSPAEAAPAGPPSRATASIHTPAESPAATRPPAPRAELGLAPIPADNLSGDWTLTTVVESSSLSQFEGLRLGYRLQLEQRGNTVRGSGRKVLENGKAIGPDGQTPITVEGTVDGGRLHMTFAEGGTRRSSAGTFVLFREGTDGLRGRFASDAARSAGRVEARRR